MSKKKVVTFGEIMLRLSTPGFSRFIQTDSFDATYGGGEANVAVSLANYGLESHFVSAVPANPIGDSAINHLRRFGVRTENVQRSGNRLGIYFLETGASQRPSKVIYDRAGSSVAELKTGTIDWANVLQGADWFHWTGITPAIGDRTQRVLAEALAVAADMNIRISCDLNFRKKLWTTDEAQAVMKPLMKHVDVCIANEEDAQKCLGFELAASDFESGQLDESDYRELARRMMKEFAFDTVAITLRESHSASRNGWSALLLDDGACSSGRRSTRYEITLVDRVGGGDAFASGLIYGLLSKDNSFDALEFAVAASCLKQTIPGDFNLVSASEVEHILDSGGSGRVQR
ncbi:MAG: sugar kinase [Rhodothermales bacterium]|nr:sugar kinase [Rhodothermales bacterium]